MVYNVLETSAENGNKLRKDDVSFINDFVTEGMHIQSVEYESVTRIGKYVGNKKRHHHHRFIVCFPIGLDFPLIILPFQEC